MRVRVLVHAWLPAMLSLSTAFAQDAPVLLGAVEGGGVQLGQVIDAALHPDGRIVLLDRLADRHVLVFSARGELLARLGPTGRGPGEIATPRALDIDARGRLFVLQAGRISLFALDPAPALLGEHRLDFSGRDLCAMDGRLYVVGQRLRRFVHELELRDTTLVPGRSLGAFDSRHPLRDLGEAYETMLWPQLAACIHATREVVWAPRSFNELHVVSVADGSQRTASIGRFQEVRVKVEGGDLVLSAPGGFTHDLLTLVPADSSLLLAHLGVQLPEDVATRSYSAFVTRIVGSRPPAGDDDAAKWLLMALDAERLVCVRQDPVPAVLVLARMPGIPRCP